MQKRSTATGWDAGIPKDLPARIHEHGIFAPIGLRDEFPVSDPDPVVCTAGRINTPHVHECFELGYCYEGEGIFLVEGKILPCGRGDAVVVNHHETHVLFAPTDKTTRWKFINLRPELLLARCPLADDCAESGSFSGPEFSNVISSGTYPDICENVRLVIEELSTKETDYRDAVRALVWALMIKLHRLKPAKAKSHISKGVSNPERIKPALRHIAENYTRTISLEKLARLCHCSEPNFRRVFKRCTGVSPQTYLLRFRVEVAKMLLRNSDRPIVDISLCAGFPTLSNFNRQFKLHTGCAPRDWRKKKVV